MITRRLFSAASGSVFFGAGLAGRASLARSPGGLTDKLVGDFAKLEADSGGRLGVAVVDTASGVRIGHRLDERFLMCSTFKLLVTAAVLARVDAGKEQLDRRIPFSSSDLVPYSPVTKERVGGTGMSLAELCEAVMVLSDNTAANVMLNTLGGPAGVTAYVRSLGDSVTRLDRYEPHLNDPDDVLDTTSPAAMAANIRTLILGTALSEASRKQLTAWMVGNKTGDTRLRAGLPKNWRVGEKTGSGTGTTNDAGLAWPPGRAPIIVAAYLTGTTAS
ncbi:MAG TPA: class A beta-lactamase, partial [Vineibacter sp.]|nr:class A beta-lactamase [Vineibacter sp.]